jgi:hypothetical protein
VPWNGSGLFQRLYNWVNDDNAGIKITASRMDADTNDIVAGLENCQTLDGQTVPTHSLPMGGFTHTNVGNATSRTNYLSAGQVVDSSLQWGGTSGGSANAQTIAITPAVTTLVAGQAFGFVAGFSNSGATTLTVNSTAATAVRRASATGPVALTGTELITGNLYRVSFDGTYLILQEAQKAATRTVLTSGSGSYTTPIGTKWLDVIVVGGGQGGQGGNAGSAPANGNTSSFGTALLTAPGGNGVAPTGGDLNLLGGIGDYGSLTNSTNAAAFGGSGGNNPMGGAGQGIYAAMGTNGQPNTGGGGGGGGVDGTGFLAGGTGGSAGGYLTKIISSPLATYAYVVGGGAAGTNGGASGHPGGNGGSGVILITEHYC